MVAYNIGFIIIEFKILEGSKSLLHNMVLWVGVNNIWNNQMYNDRYFGILNIKERKMSYPNFYFLINFFFLYFFKLFDNLWNWILEILNFANCKILKMCYFFKLNNFRNLWKFLELSKLEVFEIAKIANIWILQISNFRNFPNCKFSEFFKLKMFVMLQIWNFWNF